MSSTFGTNRFLFATYTDETLRPLGDLKPVDRPARITFLWKGFSYLFFLFFHRVYAISTHDSCVHNALILFLKLLNSYDVLAAPRQDVFSVAYNGFAPFPLTKKAELLEKKMSVKVRKS
jgi:hypothetical protein